MSIEEFKSLQKGEHVIVNGIRWRIQKFEERRIREFSGEEHITWEISLVESVRGKGMRMILNESSCEKVTRITDESTKRNPRRKKNRF